MKKSIFFLLLAALLCTWQPTAAQKSTQARLVLDTTAKTLRTQGDYKVEFTLTTSTNGVEQGRTKGTMLIKGKQFRLTTPQMITWFDGTTQWTYLKDNEEVNVSHPTKEELNTMNPYAFIDLYKSGYNYSLRSGTLHGKQVKTITLTAESAEEKLQEILLDIDPATHFPLSINLRESKDWVRISVQKMEDKQRLSDKLFRFNPKDYPQAEVIDLR